MNARFLLGSCWVLSLLVAGAVGAQQANVPAQPEKRIYKEVAGKPLEIWIWKPLGWKKEDQRSAVVFYHGGGWRGGSPSAFARQSARLAERGMVACSVQYRLTSQPGVTVKDCVEDARSAIRWVKAHAGELGIDAGKIAAGGGSAGGHLAGALVSLNDINDPADDLRISTLPAALVLFNPALKLDFPRARESGVALEMLLEVSPYHHLQAGHPPTLIFHGDADTTVPIETVQAYATKVKELGGSCEVVVAQGQPHAFFNKEPHVWQTLERAMSFLEERQLLKELR